MPRLKVTLPDGKTLQAEIRGPSFSIGRAPHNDLVLDSLSLSRQHARISGAGKDWNVEDSGSRNGTSVNGQPVTGTVPLQEGDEIRLGDVRLLFQRQATASVTLTPDPLARGEQTFFLNREALDVKRYAEQERSRSQKSGEHPNVWMLLGEAASTLIADYPLEQLLEVILDLAFKAVPAQRAALLLLDANGKLETRASRNLAGQQTLAISRTVAQAVLEQKQAVLTVDAQTDERFESAASIRIQGIRSVLCAPLLGRESVRGLIYADSLIGQRAFTENDLRLLGLIANMAAVKVENLQLQGERIEKERLDEQIEVASRIQRRLLPQENPIIAGYSVHGVSQPCYEIGGDYFDFLRRAPRRFGFVVGDVSGKGVGAALLMSAFQASLRTLARTDLGPAELIQRVNEVIVESATPGKFVTAFYAELDLEAHRLEYVNAGHNPPVLVGPAGERTLSSTGPIVGILPGAKFTSASVELEPGSLLAIYSDGLTEAENAAGEEFGLERLLATAARLRSEPPPQAAQAILQELVAFEGAAPRKDDCTLVLLRRDA
jgi:serine phosphatase RsbU (regulator of sigma subunit)